MPFRRWQTWLPTLEVSLFFINSSSHSELRLWGNWCGHSRKITFAEFLKINVLVFMDCCTPIICLAVNVQLFESDASVALHYHWAMLLCFVLCSSAFSEVGYTIVCTCNWKFNLKFVWNFGYSIHWKKVCVILPTTHFKDVIVQVTHFVRPLANFSPQWENSMNEY